MRGALELEPLPSARGVHRKPIPRHNTCSRARACAVFPLLTPQSATIPRARVPEHDRGRDTETHTVRRARLTPEGGCRRDLALNLSTWLHRLQIFLGGGWQTTADVVRRGFYSRVVFRAAAWVRHLYPFVFRRPRFPKPPVCPKRAPAPIFPSWALLQGDRVDVAGDRVGCVVLWPTMMDDANPADGIGIGPVRMWGETTVAERPVDRHPADAEWLAARAERDYAARLELADLIAEHAIEVKARQRSWNPSYEELARTWVWLRRAENRASRRAFIHYPGRLGLAWLLPVE